MTEAPLDQRDGGSVNGSRSSVKVATALPQMPRTDGSLLNRRRRLMNAVAARPSWGLFVLRLAVGAVFLESGSLKLFHVGIGGVAALFGSMQLPLPLVSAVMVTSVEVLGGLALVLGLFTRWAAALLAIDMLVAVSVVYFEPAFFKGGIQFPFTLLAACVALAISGAGVVSLDGSRVFAIVTRKFTAIISS